MDATSPYVIGFGRTDLSFVAPKNKEGVDVVLGQMSACLKAFFELHTVYSNMQLTLKMVRHYPWRGKITRAEHLGLVWFQHVNLCYVFTEKYKLSANRVNNLLESFNRPYRENVANGLKKIDSELGEFIKARGQHVHEWNTDHRQVMFLSLLEFIHKHGRNPPSAQKVKSEYSMSKMFLSWDVKRAIEFMEQFIIDSLDGYISEFEALIVYFNGILDLMKTHDDIEVKVAQKR